MNVPIPFRWRRAVALGFASLSLGGAVGAADPWPDPPPRPTRTVEVLYGTTRVWPPAPPAVVPPKPKPGPTVTLVPPTPVMRPPQLWEDPPPRVWEDPRAEPRPEQRAEPPVIEVRPIILTGHSIPHSPAVPGHANAPWLIPMPAAPLPAIPVAPAPAAPVPIQIHTAAPPAGPAPAPTQPTVVVVREQGEPRPAYYPPPEPRGFTLGAEAMLGIALGAAGLGFGYAGWRRKAATAEAATAAKLHGATPHQAADGILLMGKYNAGPRKDTAERFEIGMSYEVEKQEKKKSAEQEQAAVLEFILSQNIALHADLAGENPELPEAAELEAPEPDDTPGERTT